MKRGLVLVAMFFLFIEFSFVNAAIMHPANNVSIIIDGIPRSLESGLTYFIGSHLYTLPPILPVGNHNTGQIWVAVEDGEMTLFQAFQSAHKLCPNPTKPTTYSSSSIPNPSHLATEIRLSSGKNLQTAINDQNFCNYSYSWISSAWSAWTTQSTCLADSTRTVYCRRSPDNLTVADSFCAVSKPYTFNTCDLCRWQLYFGASVWFTAPYCPVSAPCDAGDIGTSIDCKRADGSCFFFWCTGDDQVCELYPSTICSHYG